MGVEWASIFLPRMSLLELFIRGSLIYLAIFALLRIIKRPAGSLTIADLLVVVLIADAAQNGLASDYRSVPEACVLIGTIAFWNVVLDWLAFTFPKLEWIVHPPPLPLIKNGRMLRRNMRQELVSEQELMTQLRKQGVQSVEEVDRACMEGDGHISVVKK